MNKTRYSLPDAGGPAAQQAGELCSQIAYRASQATFPFRDGRFGVPYPLTDGTSGPIRLPGGDGYLVKNSDGIGSKVLIAQLMNRHHTMAFDLMAMVADDAAAVGAEPFAATNCLDVAAVDSDLVSELFSGLVSACRVARVAMVGGEIAQLGEQVRGTSDSPYIWNADVIGIVEERKLLDGSTLAPGDTIIAVHSRGIRSNGLTLARRILTTRLGERWYEEPLTKGSWGERLLTPSLILTPFLVDLWGGYHSDPRASVHAIVHVTGGGIPGNLARILRRRGLGADLDNLYPPQPEFLSLQEWGTVSDRAAYQVWNMGNSHLIITDEPQEVLAFAREKGIEGKVAGKITPQPMIRVKSKGKQGSQLEYGLSSGAQGLRVGSKVQDAKGEAVSHVRPVFRHRQARCDATMVL